VCLAIPAQIVSFVDEEAGLAKAEISGVRRTVSVALCPEAGVGDWVLVHVGFALELIDEERARETLELLEQIGEPYQQEVRDISASCVTCSDEAVEARVVEADARTATVETDGRREQVGVELVAPVEPGDLLLCHAGIALEKLAEPR
jgi:hydrogenase expression/formation protein HypC